MTRNPSLTLFLETIAQRIQSEGVAYIRIKVTPGAPKTEFIELLDGADPTVKVRVQAPPEKGKANKALCAFLKKHFRASTMIIAGGTDSLKLIQLKK